MTCAIINAAFGAGEILCREFRQMGEFADLIIDSPVVNSLVRRDTADKCKDF